MRRPLSYPELRRLPVIRPKIRTDGVGDQAPAINAAITQAAALTGKAVVQLPPGNIRLDTSIVPKSGVALVGAGMGRTILKPYGLVSAIQDITTGTPSVPLTDLIFEDFEIDGSNQAGTYATSIKGFYITFLRRALFRNLYIHDTGATGLGVDHLQDSVIENVIVVGCGRLNDGTQPGGNGIGIGVGELSAARENLVIHGCHARSNKRYGIFVETQAPPALPLGTIVSACFSSNNQTGFGDCGGTGAVFVGCVAYANVDGFKVDDGTLTTAIPGQQTMIADCVIFDNTDDGIEINAELGETINGVLVTGCHIWSNGGNGVRAQRTAGTDLFAHVNVVNCDIHDNDAAGVFLRAVAAGATVRDCSIQGCRIWGNGRVHATIKSGIYLGFSTDGANTFTRFQITDNVIFDPQGTQTQDRGITVASTVTLDGRIEGNDLRANGIGPILNSGTINALVRRNAGHLTENNGTATVANATTSIAVNHGLSATPALDDISVTPTNDLGNAAKFWITNPTSTQFTINVDADPGAGTATFAWAAAIV